MSTFAFQDTTCAVCRAITSVRHLQSVSVMEGPDLDGRPGEMLRGPQLLIGVQRCMSCGFSAAQLDRLPARVSGPAEVEAIMRSDAWTRLRRLPDASALYGDYLCAQLVEAQLGEVQRAWRLALAAAWVADDHGEEELARLARACCAELLESHLRHPSQVSVEHLTILADVQRRAGQYEAAIASAERALALQPQGFARIAASFCLDLATRADAARRTKEDALRWAAQTRPPRSATKMSEDASLLAAGLQLPRFCVAYHEQNWSSSQDVVVAWLNTEVVPKLGLDLRRARIEVSSAYDKARYCGPGSVCKNYYVLACEFICDEARYRCRIELEVDGPNGCVRQRWARRGIIFTTVDD